MRIRAAEFEDIPRLVALERQADTAAHWGEQHYKALFPEIAGCQPDAPQRVCLVVEIPCASQAEGSQAEGKKPGVAADAERSGFRADGGPSSTQSQVAGFIVAQNVGSEWEIENLVVDAGNRRLGLATYLLRQLLCMALNQSAKAIALEVRESNQAARNFYASFGFRESGRRKGYYREPEEDAVLLLLIPDTPKTKTEPAEGTRPRNFVKNG